MLTASARRVVAGLALVGSAAVLAVPLTSPLYGAPARSPLLAPKPAAMPQTAADSPASQTEPQVDWTALTDAEWKKRLTPEQYNILRKHGTERAGAGEYAYSKDEGVYDCAACGLPLFDTDTKFESGTGWPSFYQPIDGVKGDNVGESIDKSWFTTRTEVHCNRCGGHLGHVFNDGPRPTGLRYCINSASLKLDPAEADAAKSSGEEG